MADTYRYAYLTIAATASNNSGEGCFRKVSTGSVARPLRRTPGVVVRERRWPDLSAQMLPSYEILDYPLLQRAWVYQERRMSPRMIHFTNSQLVWECQRFIQGEDGATINKEKSTAVCGDGKSTSNIFDWQTTVEEYSCLHLSFEEDRLPAISAIVQAEMRIRKDDVYMAGMWKNMLLEDLLWCRPEGSPFIRRDYFRPERTSPSWSWSSVMGPVRFGKIGPSRLDGVRITETSYIAKGLPHMGDCSEASIKLKAPFTEAAFQHLRSDFVSMRELIAKRDSSYPPSKIIVCGNYADYNFLGFQNQYLDSQQYAFVFVSLKGGQCSGLTLRRISDTEYERIGLCVCYMESDGDASIQERDLRSYLDSLPVREVKII